MSSLSRKERELTALGAAIGATCVSCIEYHIPEARTAGLSDTQILEAAKMAEKVRRVAGAKVMGTVRAHLEKSERAYEAYSQECGCPEDPAQPPQSSETDAGTSSACQAPQGVHKATVESATPQGDNMKSRAHSAHPAGATEENKQCEDSFQFDSPQKMRKMMEKCCPEGAERVSSMMGRFSADCCGSMPDSGKGKRQKPTD